LPVIAWINSFMPTITRHVVAGFVVSVISISSPELIAAETRNMTIDQRLLRIERMMENQNLVDMFMKLQSLQQEVERIRGEFEVLSHDIKGMKQSQKDLYLDLDNRIQQVEMATSNLSNAGNGASLGDLGFGSNGGDTGVKAGEPASEQEMYQAALNLLRDGKFQEASEQFKLVLNTFPSGNYSDNAQYWLGESSYVLKDYKVAISEFSKVISQYPSSSKIADAHLKIGFSHYELGDNEKARQSLEKVIKDFSGTTSARLAQSRLRQMKLQGR